MAFYPGATRRTIAWANSITRKKGYTKPEVVVLHIAVTPRSSTSLHGYFNGSGRGIACSHFHVDDKGRTEQYVDTARRSSADYSGGDRTISIETAGGSGADLNKGWSAAACEELAQILAWAHKTHGIPLVVMSNSKKGSKGVGWHRLGVPASATQKARGVSMTGGELWSGAVGKSCPGAARIAQVPGIVARAKQIAAGGGSSPSKGGGGTSKPAPIPPKPSTGKVGGEWPGSPLLADGHFGPITRRAYQRLLAWDVTGKYGGLIDGQFGPMTVRAEQTWLKKLGHYKGLIDGDRGPMTRKALQSFLYDKGLYRNGNYSKKVLVDGQLGARSIKALQVYLNSQARYA